MDLEEEAKRATELLKGKIVSSVARNREDEVLINFNDGTKLFVDTSGNRIELSIT